MKPHMPPQQCPIADPVPTELLVSEMDQLDAIVVQGDLQVYVAHAPQIPHGLREIGRLREECFRSVGEGTGQPLDLDAYDQYYLHLILWDAGQQCIAGAYRMGRTDHILAEFGPDGLLTHSFFAYEPDFLDYLNPGLELGRAFVAQSHQKSIFALALMWKGILKFVAKYPRYTKLFGCVSISDDYTRVSQDLMVRYMRRSHQSAMARLVHPAHPYQPLPDSENISRQLQSIEQVSAHIADNEPDGKGVPVLLRQYLKLNATLLEFNVDPDFNNSLDALVLVDVNDIPIKMLKRYLDAQDLAALGRV